MIVKSIPRKSRDQTLRTRIQTLTTYVRDCKGDMTKPGEKILFSGSRGFICDDFQPQVEEMVALATAGCKGKNTDNSIKHYVMSWKEGEAPSEAQASEAVDMLLRELYLSKCQVHWGLHFDTDNLHLHVVVNRVDPDTDKVLKPGGGFEKETLHRAIARIEQAQGWIKEKNARYDIGADGQCVRRDRNPDSAVQPSQHARDIEVRIGEKSQERIAIENAAPIITNAKSWQELHEGLAKIDMRYERSGVGAVIWTGDMYVKASSACKKNNSIDKLQKKLGVFEYRGKKNEFISHEIEENEQDVDNSESDARDRMWRLSTCYLATVGGQQDSPRVLSIDARPRRRLSGPVRREVRGDSKEVGDAVNVIHGVPESEMAQSAIWDSIAGRGRHEPLKQLRAGDAFTQARRVHFAYKENDRALLNAQVSTERSQLKTLQLAERAFIFQGSWKGKGLELQAMSIFLAEKHADQRVRLQENVTARRSTLRAGYKPFPELEAWLKNTAGEEAAYAWRHRDSAQDHMELDWIGGHHYVAPELATSIQDFENQVAGKWFNYAGGDGQKAFADTGRHIEVYTNDGAAILAALTLGVQKWGGVKIEGSPAFKAQTVGLAAMHGFKLENPDLALRVAALAELQTAKRQARANTQSNAQATSAAAEVTSRAAEEAKGQAKMRQTAAQKPEPVQAPTLAEALKAREASDAMCHMKKREALELLKKLGPAREERGKIAAAKKNLPAMKIVIDKEHVALDALYKDAAALGWMQLIEKSTRDKSIAMVRVALQSKIDTYNALVDVSTREFPPAAETLYQSQEAQYRLVYAEHRAAIEESSAADNQYRVAFDADAVEKKKKARVQLNQVKTNGVRSAGNEPGKRNYKPG